MIYIVFSILSLVIASIFFLKDVFRKSTKALKYIIFFYVYAIFFAYISTITQDPLNVPFLGQISPDTLFSAILAFGGFMSLRIYDFFNNIKKDIESIKNKLDKHIEKCEVRHAELDKRLNTRRK